jgi:hypothetical protein
LHPAAATAAASEQKTLTLEQTLAKLKAKKAKAALRKADTSIKSPTKDKSRQQQQR